MKNLAKVEMILSNLSLFVFLGFVSTLGLFNNIDGYWI